MKACLIFQRRFTRVAHSIAKKLRDEHGVSEFCGFVYLRSSFNFLKTQNEVPYSSLLLDQNIHDQYKDQPVDWNYIDQIEKEYGIPNLWPYIAVDRVVRHNMCVREYPYDKSPYSHEEMAKIFEIKARAIIEFLDREKPDFIFLPVVSAIGNMLFYHVGKKKGIKVLVGAETRIKQGYVLSETYTGFSSVEKRFHELMSGAGPSKKEAEAIQYITTYRDKPAPYLYVMNQFKNVGRKKELRWLYPPNLFRSAAWFATMVGRTLKKGHRDYDDESPAAFFIDRTKRKIRSFIGFDDLFENFDSNRDYAYYPLHVEPEIATLLLGPHWTNQINLIKQIAQSLPLHFKLYVKEHPAMLGYRQRLYYKELKKIPNVVLLNPNTDPYSIIKHARLITTISGTAGWEGVLFKKPVITFGHVYYNTLSTVKRMTNIEELASLVKAQLEHHAHNENELVQYVAALLENSADIGLHEIWEKGMDPEQEKVRIEAFTNLLAQAANLHK